MVPHQPTEGRQKPWFIALFCGHLPSHPFHIISIQSFWCGSAGWRWCVGAMYGMTSLFLLCVDDAVDDNWWRTVNIRVNDFLLCTFSSDFWCSTLLQCGVITSSSTWSDVIVVVGCGQCHRWWLMTNRVCGGRIDLQGCHGRVPGHSVIHRVSLSTKQWSVVMAVCFSFVDREKVGEIPN